MLYPFIVFHSSDGVFLLSCKKYIGTSKFPFQALYLSQLQRFIASVVQYVKDLACHPVKFKAVQVANAIGAKKCTSDSH
jgi:hypothetical protein